MGFGLFDRGMAWEFNGKKCYCISRKTTGTVSKFSTFTSKDAKYDLMVLFNWFLIKHKGKNHFISLCVEEYHYNNPLPPIDITMTELKKTDQDLSYKSVPADFMPRTIEESVLYTYNQHMDCFNDDNSDFIPFDYPIHLRAQTNANRIGFGDRWEWSGPYLKEHYEGTRYGETTDFVITSIMI